MPTSSRSLSSRSLSLLQRTCRRSLFQSLLLFTTLSCYEQPVFSQSVELTDEEKQQQVAADRFLTVLQKSPRRGTALDRVYSHHVEFGTLDKLIASLKDQSAKAPQVGNTWMLLGLFESQRGNDALAIESFQKAEALRKEDAIAPYYLGLSLLRVGQSDEAIAAYERAIQRNPPRADLLEIYQQLGRVLQRSQRTAEAIQVWTRLESQFPDDARVLEQIASTLADEGATLQAIPYYEKLAKITKDDYRRVVFGVEAAQLKIKADKRDQGLAEFEAMLGELKPDSWLYRDVRRRIEDVFLKSGDQDNLVKYYEKWLATHPEDVEGMARLARFLTNSARTPEATIWMDKALKLAPSRADLRRAFIDQLVDAQKFSEAVAQYEKLAESKPGNTDILRDWGKLILRDKTVDIAARNQRATEVWNQIVAARPNDALTLSQTADLFRQSNMPEPAIALYQKAIALAPNDPQYREYLGEYQHIQKLPEQALETWAAIAVDARRNAINVARLAEVYNSFGYQERAVTEILDACKLDPKDFALQIKASDYLARVARYDEAFTFMESANKLAVSADEKEEVIKQRIQLLQSSDRLDEAIATLNEETTGSAATNAAKWLLLARYLETARRMPDANDAIASALKLDEKSTEALSIAARIAEASGEFSKAVEMNRRLAEVDRRSRGDYLQNVARLESQLGRADQAMAAAQELIVSAPGNTDNYEFFAQLCFRLGRTDEGLEALRKAMRINPNEARLIVALGNALSEQLRTDEAIALYWRAFERSESIEDRISLTEKLVPLYTQLNQFEKLTERFERDRQDDQKRREATVCLAQAYRSSGDTTGARSELESLISESTRDTNLFQQLSKLCEEAGDLDAAIGYQRQLVSIAPGAETETPLAKLLQQRGELDEANEILVKLTQQEEDPVRLLKNIDSLLLQEQYDSVLAVLEPILNQQRDNWELLYREAVAWVKKERHEEAKNRFERLLAMKNDHTARGVVAEAAFKQQQSKARSDNLRGIRTTQPTVTSPLTFGSRSYEIRRAVGLEQYYDPFNQSASQTAWSPDVFGMARLATIGWLLSIDQRVDTEQNIESNKNPLLVTIEKASLDPKATRDQIYDALYLSQLENRLDRTFAVAKSLAKSGGRDEKMFFLSSLTTRNQSDQNRPSNQGPSNPLSQEELELMLSCYRDVLKSKEVGGDSSNVVFDSNGTMYVLVGGRYVQAGSSVGNQFSQVVSKELKLAGRNDEAEAMLAEQFASAKTPLEIGSLIIYQITNNKLQEVDENYNRLLSALDEAVSKLNLDAKPSGPSIANRSNPLPVAMGTIGTWIGYLGADEENAKIIEVTSQLLDRIVKVTRMEVIASTKKPQRTSTATPSPTRFSWNYGKQNQTTTLDYPLPNAYLKSPSLMYLRRVFEVLKRNNSQSDLVDLLKKRVAEAEDANKLYESLMLAAVYWWNDEKEESQDITIAVAKLVPQDLEFQFGIVAMLEARRELDEAMATLESIQGVDQSIIVRKERTMLSLAERLGDRDRAMKAAERLFGLRIDTATQMSLVDSMRRLGLTELSDAILARAEKRVGNQAASMATLMMQMQGQGKPAQAKQLAYSILNKTKPVIVTGSRARSVSSSGNTDVAARQQALQLLFQSGELKELVGKLDAQLEKSPTSMVLYDRLIEANTMMGNKDKSLELLKRAAEKNPQSPVMRMRLASTLASSGKAKEACDQYLELIKTDLRVLSNDFYEIQNIFRQANRQKELTAAISRQNIKSISQPYYIINLVSETLRTNPKDEGALELVERAFTAFPQYQSQLVSQLNGARVWDDEKLFSLIKRSFAPPPSIIQQNAWAGVSTNSYSYSSNGQINDPMMEITAALGDTKRRALRSIVDKHLQENPGWLGGKALKLMFDIQLKDLEAIRSGVHELIDQESIKRSMPATVAWMLGGSIANFQELLEESTQLMLKASEERSGMNEFQYTPGYILSKNYQKMGRKEDARKLLLSGLQSGDQFDIYSVSRAKVSSKSIADELANIGFPLDAIRVYSQLLADKEYLSQSDPFTGRSAKDTEASIKAGLQKSITAMKPEDAASAIDQLLSVGKKVSSNSDLSLGITFQSIAGTATTPIESQLLQILSRIGKNAEVIKLMQSRLELLAKENEKSIAIPIAQVALARTASGDAVGAAPTVTLEALDTFVKKQPLEPIPAGRKANARQRKEAIDYVGIWLAVKEDLAASTNNETAERLANVALEAANRQADKLATSAILWQWGEVHQSRGEIEKAEAKWSELLTMITERPVRKASEPNAANPPMPGGVPFPGAAIPGTVPARALPAPAGAVPAGLVPAGVAPAPALRPAQPTPIVKFVAFQEPASKPQETKNSTDSTKADDNKKVDNKKSVLPPRPNATGKGPVVPAPGAPSSRGVVPGGALPPGFGAPGFGPPGQMPGGVPRPSSNPNAIPPLTVSQYEVAIKIAAKAHESGLSKLSMRALQEALKGGAPVPDPVAAANPNNPAAMSTAFITSGGITRAVAVGSPQATANATNFSKATTVVRDWLSKSDSYPPKDVYDCLSSIVLPTDRESDLVMGEVSTGLAQGTVTSLGSQLVQWAKRSNQLDQLEKNLEERKTTPNLTPHRQVLLGLCALEKEDVVKAKKVLEELVSYVEKNPSPDNTALASHLALPASTRQPLQELALSILKLASSNLSNVAASSGGNARTSSSSNSLTNLVNKYYVDRGNEELIRKYFEDRLSATQVQYSNYGGDYGLQMQKQELASIATQSAMFGSAKITLEYLGRFVDFGSVRDRASTSLAVPLCAVIRSLRNTQPEEAYRTWLEWTMPNDNRKTIRVLSALMRPDSMPDEFRQQSNRNSVRMDDDVVLNLRELVSLAVKTGKLEELVIASDKARADKVPGSIELAMMIAVEKRDSDTFYRVGKELVDQSKQKNINSEGMYYSNNAANISTEVSICRLAIREGVLKIGDDLRDALVSDSTAFHLEDIHRLASQLKAERRPNVSPDFTHWTASNTSVNGIKGWWESVDQQIVHLTGAANDTLFLNYPITGNFVFNATVSSRVGLEFGFDGIGIRQQANQLLVTSRSGVSILNKPITNVREEMAQIRIESKDGRVQFFINDEIVYERQAEGSSPWVFIAAQNNTIAFSNLSLSGTPTVSESVPLVLGKRLDGWIANFYSESVFNPIVKTDNNDQVPQGYTQDPNTGELVPIDNRSVKQWTNSDGVLSIAATEKVWKRLRVGCTTNALFDRKSPFRTSFFTNPMRVSFIHRSDVSHFSYPRIT
jgi:tetratricopeptide (TPR) repeat protein